MAMYLFLFLTSPELDGVNGHISRLRSNAPVGDITIAKFGLEHSFIPFLFDTFSR